MDRHENTVLGNGESKTERKRQTSSYADLLLRRLPCNSTPLSTCPISHQHPPDVHPTPHLHPSHTRMCPPRTDTHCHTRTHMPPPHCHTHTQTPVHSHMHPPPLPHPPPTPARADTALHAGGFRLCGRGSPPAPRSPEAAAQREHSSARTDTGQLQTANATESPKQPSSD